MAIKLGRYSFSGPVESIDKLKDRSGVYAIICIVEGEYFLTDIGESSKLRTRIENLDEKECWTKNCNGRLTIYVHYTPFLKQPQRLFIAQELREIFHPGCKADKNILFMQKLENL